MDNSSHRAPHLAAGFGGMRIIEDRHLVDKEEYEVPVKGFWRRLGRRLMGKPLMLRRFRYVPSRNVLVIGGRTVVMHPDRMADLKRLGGGW